MAMPPAGRSAGKSVCAFLVRVEDLPVAFAEPVSFAVVLLLSSPLSDAVALSVCLAWFVL